MERCIDDELPFEIPENWCWARLGSISPYAEPKQKVNAANADPAIWGLDLEDIEKGGRSIVRKTVSERKAIVRHDRAIPVLVHDRALIENCCDNVVSRKQSP